MRPRAESLIPAPSRTHAAKIAKAQAKYVAASEAHAAARRAEAAALAAYEEAKRESAQANASAQQLCRELDAARHEGGQLILDVIADLRRRVLQTGRILAIEEGGGSVIVLDGMGERRRAVRNHANRENIGTAIAAGPGRWTWDGRAYLEAE